ncbi:hypothetical protein K2173_012065 [Erythroxylum novogranatense]|uniref:Uncharacterized protein n=1 Tax=Erythroxylum novogranatense TaxID=1862640 RepID=A0AAV8TGG8_9ROSI|nr:hypothetical protein K2173_012065 [Erythroxylum novogranatense]
MEDFSGYPFKNHLPCLLQALHSLSTHKIDELATFSDTPAPSVIRALYTENDVLARRYIKNWMELAGLSVREDVVGNMFGRWDGSEPDLGAVATGSHIDAIPYGGKYDGVVGVLGAIEAMNALKRFILYHLKLFLFTSEEPTRFGISCLGSRLLAGYEELAEALKTTVDAQNISFFDAAKSAGYAKGHDDLSTFIELHIEQGPILEAEVDYEGNGGHAGAVLMPERNDAGLAAAELALAVLPGAINSIPSKSDVEIDTRDIDEKRRNDVVEKIFHSTLEIAINRGVQISDFKIISQDPPAPCYKLVTEAMQSVAEDLNLKRKLMISRAYHDFLFMAVVSPMGMLFIPCQKSHKPEEYASIEDIANGVKVLALTLAKLSSFGYISLA